MVHVGDMFDNFTVISVGVARAINKWMYYHSQCKLCNTLTDKFENKVFDACLDDEYKEMKNDQFIMGVGLDAYEKWLRANPDMAMCGRNWEEQPD